MKAHSAPALFFFFLIALAVPAQELPLAGTKPLKMTGDMAAHVVASADRFFLGSGGLQLPVALRCSRV